RKGPSNRCTCRGAFGPPRVPRGPGSPRRRTWMVQVTSGASGPEVRTATTAGAGDPRVVENLWIGGGVRCDVGTPEYHPGPPHPGHPPGCSALLPPHPHLELGGHLAAAERVHRAEELGRAPAQVLGDRGVLHRHHHRLVVERLEPARRRQVL